MEKGTPAGAIKKSALIVLLKLTFLLCLIKIFFFCYNYTLYSGWEINDAGVLLKIIGWSLYYDAVWAGIASMPLWLGKLMAQKWKIVGKIFSYCAAALSTLMLLLNLADVFYFRFHRQRADADLLYVLRNPLSYGGITATAIVFTLIIIAAVLFYYFNRLYQKHSYSHSNKWGLLISLLLLSSLFFKNRVLPAAPLTSVNAVQLPLTQNSLHSFLYSLYRHRGNAILQHSFMPATEAAKQFSIHTQNKVVNRNQKNIILFIMESVPYDFFDPANKQRPALPFLDSLLKHAIFYNNAFSYSYESNKGITAILAGIPTLTDVPLYHSGYVTLPKTAIGTLLASHQYNSSFFIGDNYDDFGFAKCSNWLGFTKYYSMEAINGHGQMEKHTMGLHDEYVLNFMQQRLQQVPQPFFASFYNVSTHFPNDIPKWFQQQIANANIPTPYKSMMYYDACLKHFFTKASAMPWFKNSVFIFCSDHWANPTYHNQENKINSFRIPIFIFDPQQNQKQINNHIVSQFDIMNTVLAYASVRDSIVSYGRSLLQTDSSRVVFTRVNQNIYQAINRQYVLGFNATDAKALYCFDYKKDSALQVNLIAQPNAAIDSLLIKIPACLQTAANHYQHKKSAVTTTALH